MTENRATATKRAFPRLPTYSPLVGSTITFHVMKQFSNPRDGPRPLEMLGCDEALIPGSSVHVSTQNHHEPAHRRRHWPAGETFLTRPGPSPASRGTAISEDRGEHVEGRHEPQGRSNVYGISARRLLSKIVSRAEDLAGNAVAGQGLHERRGPASSATPCSRGRTVLDRVCCRW
jgi:hypothetical protein